MKATISLDSCHDPYQCLLNTTVIRSYTDIFQIDAQRMLKTSIANTIQEMCSCNFTHSDLEGSEVTCSADDNTTMTFTATVVYSTESGDITASTLIRMFQERAASTSTVISVGSQTANIVSVCNPSCTPETQPSPTPTPEPQVEEPSPTTSIPEPPVEQPTPTTAPDPQEAREPLTSNIAALVGAFLGGLATGIIICITAAVIKW